MHMYLLSWRVSSNRGWLKPAHSSSTQHARASDVRGNSSLTWNNTVAELRLWILWNLYSNVNILFYFYIWLKHIGPILLWHINVIRASKIVIVCAGRKEMSNPIHIEFRFLTASLTSPSFGDKVTASSRLPRLCSGYCGSFRSSVTSSVLQGGTVHNTDIQSYVLTCMLYMHVHTVNRFNVCVYKLMHAWKHIWSVQVWFNKCGALRLSLPTTYILLPSTLLPYCIQWVRMTTSGQPW